MMYVERTGSESKRLTMRPETSTFKNAPHGDLSLVLHLNVALNSPVVTEGGKITLVLTNTLDAFTGYEVISTPYLTHLEIPPNTLHAGPSTVK